MLFVTTIGEFDCDLAYAFDSDNFEGVVGETKVIDPVPDFTWEVAETFTARLAGSRCNGRAIGGKSYNYTVGIWNLFGYWDWYAWRKVIENVLRGWKDARFR